MLTNGLSQIAEGSEPAARCPATPSVKFSLGELAVRAGVNGLKSLTQTQRKRPGDRGTLYGYAWLHGTELRRIRHAGQAVLPTHQGRKAPAHLSHRRHNGLRATCSHCGPG